MPGALLIFISFRVFLTSDVMIGGNSGESGLVSSSEGCCYWSVELYSSVKKCAQIFSISFLFVLHFFIFYFTYLFLWSSFVYMFWSSTTLKYSFNMFSVCVVSFSFLFFFFFFFRDLCLRLSFTVVCSSE